MGCPQRPGTSASLLARADFGPAGTKALPSAYWHGVFRTSSDAPYVFVDLEPVPQVNCQEHCLGPACLGTCQSRPACRQKLCVL
jgi:hypothetical protein